MGTGFQRPFQRDGKGGFAKASGVDVVTDHVEAIVGSNGELAWKPELDSKVSRIRNRDDTAFYAQFAAVYIQEAIATFEPDVSSVAVTAQPASGGAVTLAVGGQYNGQAIPPAEVNIPAR